MGPCPCPVAYDFVVAIGCAIPATAIMVWMSEYYYYCCFF